MRIVGGRLGGRSIKAPSSNQIRPTSDRLRESLFNIIAHSYGGVDGARVIDLFAGTGALAIEAISRGARFALFVDDGAEARALIRANVESLGLGGITRIFRRDARKLGEVPAGERFNIAFLDPPYSRGFIEPALASLRDGYWLAAGALVLVEESAEANLEAPEGYDLQESRAFGGTQISILRTL